MREPSPTPRPVARVLLFDGAARILLLHEASLAGGGPYWYTPGGGIEPGESARQAAARELREELGVEAELGSMILRRRTTFDVGERHLDQDECHFVGRLRPEARHEPRRSDPERAAAAACRWWTVDELRSSRERFFPEGLADLAELAGREAAGLAPVDGSP